jgi:exonuclease SbcD
MTFFHLADLHIGKSVNGFSMLAEQKHVLEQVIGTIQSERPDAVIIAGEVYDRAVPSVEAVRLFDDFLTALAREEAAVLLIAGNHDAPERLAYGSRLLADKRLYLCGAFDGAIRKVTLPDAFGEVNFWLLPFIKPAAVRGFFGDRPFDTYNDALAAVLETADMDWNARNVLISHQFYTRSGVSPERSDSESNPIGGLDAMDAAPLDRFDYAALGHLHGAQTVGRDTIRYAGSPLKYSFSERGQRKGMNLVELGEKGSVTVTRLPLTPLHDMRQIQGPLEELRKPEIVNSADPADYLRVILTDEDEPVDAIGKLRSVYPHIMSLDFENARTSIGLSSISAELDAVQTLSPYELFSEFFLEMRGSVMSDEQAAIVRDLLEEEGDA